MTAQTKEEMMAKAANKPVVVTTAHRGVFFGYIDGQPTDAPTIRIERARMCVYWSADIKGILGLAATGPNKNCKISPAVPALTLREVTSVMQASEEARKMWETVVWK